jgi:hypothetical protein
MTYTREQWSIEVLHILGNTSPSQDIINWLTAWTLFETNAGSGASYNLLNTTLKMEGSTDFNSVGVQNFISFEQGISANAATISNGFYSTIFSCLKDNNAKTLMNVNLQVDNELTKWGTGPVQRNIIASMGRGLKDQFQGTDGMTTRVPQDWIDDGKTLRSPDGKHEITEGFRDWILNSNWDASNWAITDSIGSSSLEGSNPSLGPGTYQMFRKSRLEWTQSGGVIECYLGVEFVFVEQQRNVLQMQVNADQVLLANLKVGLPRQQIAQVISDCQSLLSKLQSIT